MPDHSGEIPGQISIEEAIADVERSVRALGDAVRQNAPAEQPAAEQLTEQQLANRAALANRLRDADKHARTVHPGQYGRSLAVLLRFLSHIIDDPTRPLGLMPHHAQHVADHLTEQASDAHRADLCKGTLGGYPFWHDEGGNTVRIAPEPDGLGVNFWVTECGNEDGPRLGWEEIRDIGRHLAELDAHRATTERNDQ
ncbi:hypothetical protein [Saccharopolyspora taberi]|uniref:Uncharacterized protein n=1 Tax=Saccharopolyspora taberi TaxID=60895 RepID=A0ABN3UZR8_9PSEU